MTQAIAAGTFGHIGYGLFTQRVDGHLLINHPGGMLGYESMMLGDLDDGIGIVVLLSGKCWPWPQQLAQYGLQLLSATLQTRELPVAAPPSEPKKVANAADYAGTFTMRDQSLTFIAEDGQVILLYRGNRIILEERWHDYFFIVLHNREDVYNYCVMLFRCSMEKIVMVGDRHNNRFASHAKS